MYTLILIIAIYTGSGVTVSQGSYQLPAAGDCSVMRDYYTSSEFKKTLSNRDNVKVNAQCVKNRSL